MSAGQTVILNSQAARGAAMHLLECAPKGSVVTVKPPTRSLDQNAKMHAMLSDVSRAKPEGRVHTPDVWKCLFMAACGHEVQFLMGLDGNPFPAGFRSSRLSKDQMAELLSFIDAWGSERGVQWSDEA